MKRVYIGRPFSENPEESRAAVDEICGKIGLEGKVQPFSPIHAFGFLDPKADQRQVMTWCLQELAGCDELWVFGEAGAIGRSKGLQAEIRFAIAAGIPILRNGKEPLRLVPYWGTHVILDERGFEIGTVPL